MHSKLALTFLILAPAILNAAGTTTTLSSSADPAEFGHAVTLTAAVKPSTATGKVTFYDGTTVLETETLVGGKAVFTTTLLASGARSLKAYYEGDPNDAPSTSAILTEQVTTVSGNGFQTPAAYPAGAYPYSAVVGDFNNDGKTDLALADDGYVTILMGNGDGTFQSAVNYSTGASLDSIQAADFNGDGKMDLAASSASSGSPVAILLGNGDGTFQAPINYSSFGSSSEVAVGDFNGDGKPDLAIADGDSVLVALGNGDGTFQVASTTYTGDSYVTAIAVGDFNGDGKADLAIGTETLPSTIFVLLGGGDGTFVLGASSSLPEWPDQITVADLNGDGKADLAVAEPALGSFTGISILLANGDGTFQAAVNYSIEFPYQPAGGGPVVVSDFNGDGIPDTGYAVSNDNGANNLVSVYVGNGDGSFQAPVYYALSYSYLPHVRWLTAGDFNGDGRADFAGAETTNGTTGAVDVIINSVVGAPTTAALTSSVNPSTYGQTVMLTATVTPATATGTIAFRDGSTLLGSGTLAGGIATLSISILSGGQHSLTAIYGGDTYDAPSTSPVLTQSVNPAPTSVTISSSPDPSTYRQAVTVTADVTSPMVATGTVTFYSGTVSLGPATLKGNVATLSLASLPAGANQLTAAYGGDANDQPSTSPSRIQVVRDPTSTVLTSSSNPSTYGQAVLLTATLTPSKTSGKVTFYQGTTAIGTSTLSGGTATLSISTLAVGDHVLTASYNGNAAYSPSESPILVQAVKQ